MAQVNNITSKNCNNVDFFYLVSVIGAENVVDAIDFTFTYHKALAFGDLTFHSN